MDPRTGALSEQEDEPEKPLDDLELVERAKRKDPVAAGELVRRYQDKAYAIAYRTCSGDREEARDFTQEAFLNAFRNLKQFHGKASFYTWLYRIVVNTCLDGLRRNNRRRWLFSPWRSEEGDGAGGDPEGCPGSDQEENPAAVLSRKELNRAVQKALSGLSIHQRMVFELKVFDEMSIPEIASLLNSAEGTVKRMKKRPCVIEWSVGTRWPPRIESGTSGGLNNGDTSRPKNRGT